MAAARVIGWGLLVLGLLLGGVWPSGGGGASERIAEAVRWGEGAVDLPTLAPFPWTHVHVIPPYAEREYVERRLGTPYPFAWARVLTDEYQTLVFGERVAAVFQHSRGAGDFLSDSGGSPACRTPAPTPTLPCA